MQTISILNSKNHSLKTNKTTINWLNTNQTKPEPLLFKPQPNVVFRIVSHISKFAMHIPWSLRRWVSLNPLRFWSFELWYLVRTTVACGDVWWIEGAPASWMDTSRWVDCPRSKQAVKTQQGVKEKTHKVRPNQITLVYHHFLQLFFYNYRSRVILFKSCSRPRLIEIAFWFH